MKKIITFILLLSCITLISCVNQETTNQVHTTSITDTTTTQHTTTTVSDISSTTTFLPETTVTTTTVPSTTFTEEITTTVLPTTTTETTTITTSEFSIPAFTLQMQSDTLKILQLTDLHLKYTADDTATKTLNLMTDLINTDSYDIVIITGDLTLSPAGPAYFLDLIEVMEACQVPWTFVFGNHETDYNDYQEFLDVIPETEYLYFDVGPTLEEGGYGNFFIRFEKQGVPFYDLIMMDSHAEREEFTAAEGRYDYIKESQVNWYKKAVEYSPVNNLVFMHIPLRQYLYNDGYIGEFNEYVCPQGRDTGLFDAFVEYDRTKGIFVGHDHVNDFYFEEQGIILAYGRNTGYGGYGEIERGARVIEINSNQEIVLSLILESELT